MPRFFCLLLFLLSFSACGPNFVYEQTHSIASDGWGYDQPLQFDFEVSDTNQLYNLHLVLAHTTAFAYQNLYVKIKTSFPNGETLEEQVSLELADKFGQWLGACSKEDCELPIIIQQKAYFNQLGKHQIEISQWTRDNPLTAIQSLGFKLELLDLKRNASGKTQTAN